MASSPVTPDGRYFVVQGTLWRRGDPGLNAATRRRHVNALMAARRAVRAARGDPDALGAARARVQAAKEALGERGPVWWHDGAPPLDRHKAANTPYADWFAALLPPMEP